MSYHDCSTPEQPAPHSNDNGSPEAKFILVFNPLFQEIENAFMLNELGSVEMPLSLLQGLLMCISFVLVLFF